MGMTWRWSGFNFISKSGIWYQRAYLYCDLAFWFLTFYTEVPDYLCGLVVRVPGYRSREPGLDSRRYQIWWEVVGLERGPLSLVITIEGLLGRKNRGSGLEIREYGRRDPSRWPRGHYPWKLALTTPTSGGWSVGIVRSRTKATKLLYWGPGNKSRGGLRGGIMELQASALLPTLLFPPALRTPSDLSQAYQDARR
jgi:hypothetical protein